VFKAGGFELDFMRDRRPELYAEITKARRADLFNGCLHIGQSVIIGKLPLTIFAPEALLTIILAVSYDIMPATILTNYRHIWGFYHHII